MIINSNLKYTLLKEGGFKLFSHKILNKPKLPQISSNYKKKLFLHNLKPYKNIAKKLSVNKCTERNFHKKYNFINNTESIDDISLDLKNNYKGEQSKSIGISRNLDRDKKDFLLNDKTLSKCNPVDNNNITLMTFETDNDSNLHLFNNLYNDYKKRNSFYDNNLIDDNLSYSTSSIDSLLKDQEYKKKKNEIKKQILKINEKRKFDFMKKVLKNDKNFLIDDYLRNKTIQKTKKFLLNKNNNSDRSSFLNNQNLKPKKEELPILVKDITIKSLLNKQENKKLNLLKLKPLILNENYLFNRYGKDMNKVNGINKFELKINLRNKKKYHIKLGNNKNIFNLNYSK